MNPKLTSCDYKKLRHRNRRRKEISYKRRLESIYKNSKTYLTPVEAIDTIRGLAYVKTDYYNHNNGTRRFQKSLADRTVRRYNCDLGSGSNYKRIYDYKRKCF